MSKTVKGFKVRNQQRKRIRGDLSGEYEGLSWYLRSEGTGLFRWDIGKLTGFASPTLGDALRAMRKAALAQRKLKEEFGELDEESMRIFDRLARWEHMALNHRLEITGPHGKDKDYYKVRIKPPL